MYTNICQILEIFEVLLNYLVYSFEINNKEM